MKVLCLACFGAFGLGTGLSWTSPTLPVISENNEGVCADEDNFCYWDDPKDALTADEASWVGGLFNIGAMVSAFVTGYCMEAIGRKWTMILMVVPFVAGWTILTMTGPLELTDAWWFYAGRLLTGFGGGAFSLSAPIYISETSEPSIRGALGSLMQFMITVGVLFNNGIGALIEWDVLTGLCLVFPSEYIEALNYCILKKTQCFLLLSFAGRYYVYHARITILPCY